MAVRLLNSFKLIGCVCTLAFTVGCGRLNGLVKNLNEASSSVLSLSLDQASLTLSEGSGALINVILSDRRAVPTVVNIVLSSPRGDAAVDFQPPPSSVTIPAGSLSRSLSLTVNSDSIYEGNEDFTLTATPAETGVIAGPALLNLIVTDTEPTVTFASSAQTVAESAGTATVSYTQSGQSNFNTLIPYTLSGTATGGGTDYNLSAGTFTIIAGQTSGSTSFSIIDDAFYEANETILLTLGTPTYALLGATTVHTVTINDDDALPTVNFTASSQNVSEAVGAVTVNVAMTSMSGSSITIPFTLSGTATGSGTDHNAVASSIVIAAGLTTGSYSFTVIDDALVEGNETILFTMGAVTGATLGATSIQTVVINDDDGVPTVNFSASSQTVAEGVGTVTVGVVMSAISATSVTIPFTLSGTATGSGTDHNLAASDIIISAGQTTGSTTFTVTDDTLYEITETVVLSMGTPSGAAAGTVNAHTVNITDNDTAPSISIADVSVTEGTGGGTTTAAFTVQLDAASGAATTVAYATAANTATGAGTDYTNASGTLTIAAGSTTGVINVTITRDSLYETNETFYVNLSSPTNATISDNQGLGTITDDDSAPTVNFSTASQSVVESVGTVTITLQLSAVSGVTATIPFTLTGTATNGGTDFATPSSPVTIAAGSTTANITFSINDDSLFESTETVILTMGATTAATAGATSIHTVSITDNDSAPTLSIAAASGYEGGNAVFTVTQSATSGSATTFSYATSAGTATGGGTDYTDASGTATIAAGSTTVTLTVALTDDTADEQNETFTMTISAPSGATIASGSSTGTIIDTTLWFNLTTGSLPSGLSFTRTSTATYFDSSGVMQTAASGTPRYDYDPATLNLRGVLIERQNTNILKYSEQLDQSDWIVGGASVTANAVNGLFGSSAGDLLTEDVANSSHHVYQALSAYTLNSYVTLSTFVKLPASNSRRYLMLELANSGNSDYLRAVFDVANGQIVSSTANSGANSQTAYIQPINNGWYRVGLTGVVTGSAGSVRAYLRLSNSTSSATTSYSGDGTSGLYLWGAQVEAGPVPTSYIATTTAGVTRAADYLQVSSFGTWYTSNWTMNIDLIRPQYEPLSASFVPLSFMLSDGSSANTVQGEFNSYQSRVAATASSSFRGNSTPSYNYSATELLQSVSTQSSTDIQHVLNNTAGSATASTPIAGLTELFIGGPSSSSSQPTLPANSWLRKFTYRARAISQTNALAISTDDTITTNWVETAHYIPENIGTVTIAATLNTKKGSNVTIPFTVSGTATGSGTDHNLAAGTLTINANNLTGTTTFTVTDDSTYEGSETVILTMGSATGATVISPSIQTITILDNDAQPAISIADTSVTEGTGGGTTTAGFTISLDHGSSQNVTVGYTTNANTATGGGTDYTNTSGTLTIAAGATTGIVSVTITRDSVYESNETFYLDLSSPTNATISDNQGLGTITDDDTAPTVNFSAASQSVSEGAGNATITLQLSAASGVTTTIPFTLTGTATNGGTDYVTPTSPVTIAAGSTTASLSFSIIDDTSSESNETVILTMGSVTGATVGSTSVHTVTILDNDLVLSIADTTVAENVAGGNVTVTISANTTANQNVTVNWASSNGTATAAADYTASSGTATILSGSSTGTLTVPILNDSTFCESSETFLITMSSPSSGATLGTATATITITENDIPTLTTSDVSVIPGVAFDFKPTLSTACPSAVTFNYATSNGTATSGSDYTATSGTGTIAANSTSTTISVPTATQTIASNRAMSFILSALPATVTASSTTITGTIAAPVLDYDFTSSLPGGVTFSRNTIGTYFDSSRMLQIAAADSPRFEYDPDTGQSRGILIEGARTNIFTYSQSLTNAAWNAGNGTVTSNAGIAPDGSLTAQRFAESTTASAIHYIDRSLSSQTVNTDWSFSTFVKANGRTMMMLTLYQQSTSHQIRARFDLSAGTVLLTENGGNATVNAAKIQSLPNGWYRVSVSGLINSAGSTATLIASMALLTSLYGDTYTGNGSNGIYLWGMQLEQGAAASSYIPTGASTVTRAEDRLDKSGMGFYNTSQGTFFAKAFLPIAAGTQALFYSVDGGYTDGIYISRSNGYLTYSVDKSSVNQAASYSMETWASASTKAAAVAYASNDIAAATSGVIRDTDSSATIPVAPAELRLARIDNSTGALQGYFTSFQYYDKRLNNASLVQLTTTTSPPALFVTDVQAIEGQNLNFVAKLSSTIGSAVTATWTATNGTGDIGTDLSGATTGTLTIAAGSLSATIALATVDDTTIEGNETINFTLSGLPATVVAGDVSAVGTIQDATLNFDFSAYPTSEGVSMPGGTYFSRASSGTYFNSSGTVVASQANYLLQTTDLYNSTWTLVDSYVTQDSTLSPDLVTPAWKLSEKVDASANTHSIAQNVSGLSNSTAYIASVYAKSSNRNLQIKATLKNASTSIAVFNIQAGTVSSCPTTCSITSLSNGWYRLTMTLNSNTGATTPVMLFQILDASLNASYTADGRGVVYLWGAQLEPGSTVSPYIQTASAINYAPRYDYDPATCVSGTIPTCTRVSRGLLIENSITNTLLQSGSLSTTPWTTSNATATVSSTLALDGTNYATQLIESTANSTHTVYQTASLTASTIYTFSTYVKANGRWASLHMLSRDAQDHYCQMDLTTFAVAASSQALTCHMLAIGNGWARIGISANSATGGGTPRFTIEVIKTDLTTSYVGDNSSGLYLWGAQVEDADVPTSYTPTTTSTVIRSKDVAQITGFYSWYNSSTWSTLVYFSRLFYEPTTTSTYLPRFYEYCANATCANNRISHRFNPTAPTTFSLGAFNSGSGTSTSSYTSTPMANVSYKVGGVLSSSTLQTYFNGNSATATGAITIPTVDDAYIGGQNDRLNGYVRTFQYFPRALTNSQMTTFTQ